MVSRIVAMLAVLAMLAGCAEAGIAPTQGGIHPMPPLSRASWRCLLPTSHTWYAGRIP